MTSETAFTQCDALVLAGARDAQDPVAGAANVGHKALAEIAGRPMIAWVFDALLESPRVRRIFVSAPTDELLNDAGLRKYHDGGAIQFTQSGGNPGDSVARALEDKSIGSPLLVTTCDNPLLSLESIEELAHIASTKDIDLAVGLAHETAVSGVQLDGKRTYLRFRDGGYSGCNLFLFKTWESRRVAEFWGSIDSIRKAPRKIVRRVWLWRGFVILIQTSAHAQRDFICRPQTWRRSHWRHPA